MGVLQDVRSLIGITDTAFDNDLRIHINTTFSILNHLGVGPEKPFIIDYGKDREWSEFVYKKENIEMVKSYVYFKTLLMFDPPTSSSALDAIKRNIDELEWRLNALEDTDDNNKCEVVDGTEEFY